MNKIININLAGRLIPIDESAYELLHRYLTGLKQHFTKEPGGTEIVHDMEDRIGELFQEKIKKGQPCITTQEVDEMIAIMGSPHQIMAEAGAEDSDNGTDSGAQEKETDDKTRRLHRSSQDKVIGGVCGGMANYFHIDPVVVRVIFALISLAWGTGIIIYLLLWALLPERKDQPSGLRRRLYRDPEHRLIGGVASGIAAYLNIDTLWPRLIFLLPAFSGIGFTILDDDFLPFSMGGIPSMVLLYIVLWIALPEAVTVAEKLEMKGRKVDVKNLSAAIQSGDAANLPTKKDQGRSVLAVLLKIFLFLIAGVIFISLISGLIAIFFSSFHLGVFSTNYSFAGLITEQRSLQWLFYISLIVLLLVPLYGLIRLLVYLISGRKTKPLKWLSVTLSVLFILSIFSMFWIAGTVARDFNVRYHKTEDLSLQPVIADTFYISQGQQPAPATNEMVERVGIDEDLDFRFLRNDQLAISNVEVVITKSPDSLFHLQVERSAYGSTSEKAKSLALPLAFDYHQAGNQLFLPDELILTDKMPFRGQQIIAKVMIPAGKVFYLDNVDAHSSSFTRYSFRKGGFSYVRKQDSPYDDHIYYKMDASGQARGIDTRATDDWD